MRNAYRLAASATILTLLVLCTVFDAVAQNAPAEPWNTETVNSPTLGKRTFYVATPDDYRSGTKRYPVVVMLDGNDIPMLKLLIASRPTWQTT